VAGLAVMAWVLWALGYPDLAAKRMGASLRRVEAIADPHTLAYASYYASVLHALRREYEVARVHAARCFSLAGEHGFRHWRSLSNIVERICANLLEPSQNSLASVDRELSEYIRNGYSIGVTALYVLLCGALVKGHEPVLARESIIHGLGIAERTGECIFAAELHRLQAVISDAETPLNAALTIARGQQARSLELRATQDLCGIWHGRGQIVEARDLLAPIYAWFTEGFDTCDLREARELLEQLLRAPAGARTKQASSEPKRSGGSKVARRTTRLP